MNITGNRLKILKCLEEKPQFPYELMTAMGKNRATITPTLAELRKADLVKFTIDLNDARFKFYELTEKGKEAIENGFA